MPIKIFTPLFQRALSDDVTKEQGQAVVDALIFAIMADGVMVDEERQELYDALDQLGWDEEMRTLKFVGESMARVEDAQKSGDAAKAYAKDIATRLGDETLKEKTYHLAARIICADRAIDMAERGLMGIFIEAFELDRDTAIEIALKAHEEFDLM